MILSDLSIKRPIFATVMMLALPSGLTLYIFVNTVLTMIHQWYMNKKDPPAPHSASGSGKAEPKRQQPQQRWRPAGR